MEAIHVRPAQPNDQGSIAELMYSSGSDLYDYLYAKKAIDYLIHEFNSGYGFAGYSNVTVAVCDGQVVGTGCFYGADRYKQLLNGSMKNMSNFFGKVGVVPVLWRARHLGSVMKPPKHGEIYLSNFGVSPQMRSQGIGTQIIQRRLQQAIKEGFSTFGLDVSSKNPKGQALYERLGLHTVEEKTFPVKNSGVAPCFKMEKVIKDEI